LTGDLTINATTQEVVLDVERPERIRPRFARQ
jgi:polyisoprenoid-binding protein YceI